MEEILRSRKGGVKDFLYRVATDKQKGAFIFALKLILYFLSIIYGFGVCLLRFFWQIKPRRLNCKVISVGNVTLGGTGKTPLVEYIARYLRDKGHKVALLSRGYGKRKAKSEKRKADYQTMGDEPCMLLKKLGDLPVIVDKDRVRSAKEAIKDYSVDTVILDDGFQQWRLKKDLEIVTIDATNPLGNKHLLPRGILREPLSSLRRAQVFVLTKVNLKQDDIGNIKRALKKLNPDALVVEATYEPLGFYKLGEEVADNLLGAKEFAKEPVSLVYGIAEPQSFENLISNLGITIGSSFGFPDHYLYREEDLKEIIRDSKEKGISKIITTEKDAVRLPAMNYELLAMDCFVLSIQLEIIQDEIFNKRLLSIF
ncbi:MAG: tetraacyldisaccharide 4'-kinase [Candidatus Omnitrophica bacterium]|nr:tetraacyldisaccharide 4'-kinase [Candidatus Omnitrophota bacterium]